MEPELAGRTASDPKQSLDLRRSPGCDLKAPTAMTLTSLRLTDVVRIRAAQWV